MTPDKQLVKAINIASRAFLDVKDKTGHPYILHCLAVMQGVEGHDFDVMAAAVLHDLIEDTSWTIDDLIREGFSLNVVDWIDLLTRRPGEEYTEYIKRLSVSKEASKIKIADLRHNMKLERISNLPASLVERYQKAFNFLRNI
jgi:(p)ppGpp synthase/HD superfamily hydrolase